MKTMLINSTDSPLPGRSIKITTKGELLWMKSEILT